MRGAKTAKNPIWVFEKRVGISAGWLLEDWCYRKPRCRQRKPNPGYGSHHRTDTYWPKITPMPFLHPYTISMKKDHLPLDFWTLCTPPFSDMVGGVGDLPIEMSIWPRTQDLAQSRAEHVKTMIMLGSCLYVTNLRILVLPTSFQSENLILHFLVGHSRIPKLPNYTKIGGWTGWLSQYLTEWNFCIAIVSFGHNLPRTQETRWTAKHLAAARYWCSVLLTNTKNTTLCIWEGGACLVKTSENGCWGIGLVICLYGSPNILVLQVSQA